MIRDVIIIINQGIKFICWMFLMLFFCYFQEIVEMVRTKKLAQAATAAQKKK